MVLFRHNKIMIFKYLGLQNLPHSRVPLCTVVAIAISAGKQKPVFTAFQEVLRNQKDENAWTVSSPKASRLSHLLGGGVHGDISTLANGTVLLGGQEWSAVADGWVLKAMWVTRDELEFPRGQVWGQPNRLMSSHEFLLVDTPLHRCCTCKQYKVTTQTGQPNKASGSKNTCGSTSNPYLEYWMVDRYVPTNRSDDVPGRHTRLIKV